MKRLGDGRASTAGGLGDRLVAREAKPAPGVVEGPEERLEHGQRLGGDLAIGPALLGPAGEAARPVHDPDLGVAVEGARAAKAEKLLSAGGASGGPKKPAGGFVADPGAPHDLTRQSGPAGLYGLA